jgi:DnaK suppressor protein
MGGPTPSECTACAAGWCPSRSADVASERIREGGSREGEHIMVQTRKSSRRTSSVLPPKVLAALRRKLVEERRLVVNEYQHDMAAAHSTQGEGAEDFEELASMGVDREQLFACSEQERERLRLIEEALQRMEDGTYGLCLWSGEPIPAQRLRAIPWARYRAEVQARLESGELVEHPVRGKTHFVPGMPVV